MHYSIFARYHLCSEMVTVDCTARNGAVRPLEGNLEEIGEWSALVLTGEMVQPGTKIRFKAQGQELKGSVRSCACDGVLGFFVDIELDADSRWSEKWFTPQHLFKLCPSMRYFTEESPKVTEEFVPANLAHA